MIKKILFLVFLLNVILSAQVQLPKLISDGMILQRDTEIKIWGWASPSEKVNVCFLEQSFEATADSKGNWFVKIPEQKAGGPFEMKITASNEITIKNILIGDVWVCSGQSNMELPMQRVSPIYHKEIENSQNPFIRQFVVPQRYDFKSPRKDLENGNWEEANPTNILKFSAAAYFFAKEIYEKYKVPVGLINASLGGSPAEAWMSEEALKEFPHYLNEAYKFRDDKLIKDIEGADNKRISEWYKKLNENDEGLKDKNNLWYGTSINHDDWDIMNIPGYWQQTKLGAVNGAVWFRKKINIPDKFVGRETKLIFGRIVDADSIFVNGEFVGTTSYQYPPRRYDIPFNVLKNGENIIAIRVINNFGIGGFVPDKDYEIVSGVDTLDLKGEWHYKLGATMHAMGGQTFIRWKPMGLFNAMIAPLLNYKIKGVAWYQGESNANRPFEYRKLFAALIKDWRCNWGIGDFPFVFVQLPNFMEPKSDPYESYWALMREAQFKSLSVPNTGMAVTIDIGEWNDVHPLNKKDVGKRLAYAAFKCAYNENDVPQSPYYKSMVKEDNKIILTFENIGSGLISKNGLPLKKFSIAGEDKKFVWAKAEIIDNKIYVSNEIVKNPVAVRYAWSDNPSEANLFNVEGLPASPFRTDDF